MPDRVKKSVSMPSELDARIVAAAEDAGLSYSAWLARSAARQLAIRDGLAAVAEWAAENGEFTAAERAEADAWVAAHLHPNAASEGSPAA